MGTLYQGYQTCGLSVHFIQRYHRSHSDYTEWPGWVSNKILLFKLQCFSRRAIRLKKEWYRWI